MHKSEAKKMASWIGAAVTFVFILWRGFEAANGRGNVLLSGIVGGMSYAITYLIAGAYFYFARDINIFGKD